MKNSGFFTFTHILFEPSISNTLSTQTHPAVISLIIAYNYLNNLNVGYFPLLSEAAEDTYVDALKAHPENWYERFGVSYEIKQKRDGLINAVSAGDIRNRGTKVINPFIGVLPSIGELEDDLEDLLDAME